MSKGEAEDTKTLNMHPLQTGKNHSLSSQEEKLFGGYAEATKGKGSNKAVGWNQQWSALKGLVSV